MQGLAAVAQLDRVLGYEPRGRGFDSCQPHQIKTRSQKPRVFSLFRRSCITMSKAFTRESDADDDEDDVPLAPAPQGKNYLTRAGYDRLRAELFTLIDEERPRVVDVVHWAAGNGDRSENGDYL